MKYKGHDFGMLDFEMYTTEEVCLFDWFCLFVRPFLTWPSSFLEML